MKNPGRYLIIDDDNTSNLICKFTIQKVDKEAIIYSFLNPEEALEIISKGEIFSGSGYVVLLLDVNMPEMTGVEFLQKFEGLPSEFREKYKIYMLTSSIEDLPEKTKEFLIVSGFLSKPIKVNYLEEIQREIAEELNLETNHL